MPLLWLGLCVIAGIFTSARLQVGEIFWAVIAIAGLLGSLPEVYFSKNYTHPLLSRKTIGVPASLLLAAFALGAWRFQISSPGPTSADLAYYQPDPAVVVSGTVISYPELTTFSSAAIVKVDAILVDGREIPVKGKLELRLLGGFHLAYGDRLRMAGSIKSALTEDQAFYSSYLARRGIMTRMAYPQIETLSRGGGAPLMALIFNLRAAAHTFIQNQMPFQESSLISGILLGIDWHIPGYLKDAYRVTGTYHIIAISGFNIALISGLVARLFRRIFPPVWAGLLAVLAIVLYTLMVGTDPSVVRAAIMGSLSIPAFLIGRRTIAIHSLIVTGAVMLMLNPLLFWDLGFQLSFSATLGLLVLANPLMKWYRDRISVSQPEALPHGVSPIVEIILSTMCAQFAVSPFILSMRPVFHPFALPANIFILPLQPSIMVLGGLAVLTSFIAPPIGMLVARAAWLPAALSNQLALHFGRLRLAEFPLPPRSSLLAGCVVFAVMIYALVHEISALSKPNPADETESRPDRLI